MKSKMYLQMPIVLSMTSIADICLTSRYGVENYAGTTN
jgi:hypothetical protein